MCAPGLLKNLPLTPGINIPDPANDPLLNALFPKAPKVNATPPVAATPAVTTIPTPSSGNAESIVAGGQNRAPSRGRNSLVIEVPVGGSAGNGLQIPQ